MGMENSQDAVVLDAERQADVLAIKDLAIAYAHSVDDRDWVRWEALFVPDAHIDYLSAGGIAGTPSELAAWMPDALAAFKWCLHSMFSHEIRFLDDDHATGRVHVFNRNGVEWDGEPEILDVGGVYVDRYVRVGDAWRFAQRVEQIKYITGGRFADMVRDAAGVSS